MPEIPPEFLVYNRNGAPFFDRDFNHFTPRPVSHDTSRKKFFAKLFGLIAVAGLAPKLLAKGAFGGAKTAATPALPVAVQAETRAVARRSDSV